MALTLKDWNDLGLGNGARAISKGSEGVRIKNFHWSPLVTEALTDYFNKERKKFDPFNWDLENYLRRNDDILLSNTPLFLSRHGTQLQANTFRLKYWNRAIKHAGIRANIHQTRHWFVTHRMREIFEKNNSFNSADANVTMQLDAFFRYMKWKSRSTLSSYDHLFDQDRLKPIQSKIYANLESRSSDEIGLPLSKLKTKSIGLKLAEQGLNFVLNMARKK